MASDPEPLADVRTSLALRLADAAEWVFDWLHRRELQRLRLVLHGTPLGVLPPDVITVTLFTPDDTRTHQPTGRLLLCVVTPRGERSSAVLFRHLDTEVRVDWAPRCVHFLVWFSAPPDRAWFRDFLRDAALVGSLAAGVAPVAGTFLFDGDDAPLARADADAAAPRPRGAPPAWHADLWRGLPPEVRGRGAGGLQAWLTNHRPGWWPFPDWPPAERTLRRLKQEAADGLLGADLVPREDGSA